VIAKKNPYIWEHFDYRNIYLFIHKALEVGLLISPQRPIATALTKGNSVIIIVNHSQKSLFIYNHPLICGR
jgi:hypothetical protein